MAALRDDGEVAAMTPPILYEDNHLLVAIKPHMVPSQADASGDPDMLTLLKAYIKEKYQKPGEVYLGLVHRLDRPAGGVMVFARTSKAAARLAAQMQEGRFQKTYLAVVTGNPPPAGDWEDDLLKDEKSNTVHVVPPGKGKRAHLAFRVLGRREGMALCQIQLLTGRPHQIRVQFASRGFSLYGDARYGRGEGEHLALFSQKIELEHPTKKIPLVFSEIPEGEPFSIFARELARL